MNGAWRRLSRLVFIMTLAAPVAVLGQGDAARLYEEANALHAQDDLEGALLRLKESLSLDTRILPSHILLARIFLQLGEGAAAADAIDRARRLGADPVIAWPLRAQAMFQQGKHQDLVQFVPESGLPQDVQADLLVMRGRAYLELNNLTAAAKSFDAGRTLAPQSGAPQVGLAAVAFRAGDLNLAEIRALGAVRIAPDDGEAWNMLGPVYHARGHLKEAREAYNRALENVPTHQDARASRAGLHLDFQDYDLAEGDVAYLRDRYPFDPRGAYLEAVVYAKTGRPGEARESLEMAASLIDELDPGALTRSPQLQLLAGIANYELGSFEAAQNQLSQYIQSYPDQIGPRKLLATIMLSQQRAKGVIEILDPVLDRAQNDHQLQSLLGTAYMQMGRHDTALMHLERASALNPDSTGLRTKLAMSRMGAGFKEQGLDDLKALFYGDPERNKTAGLRLAIVLMQNARADEAVEVARTLETMDPTNLTVLNLHGSALLRAGREDEARIAFEAALAADPKFMPARLNLGKLAMGARDPTEARERFASILVDEPSNLRAMRALAQVEERAGDVPAALRWLQKARAIDPRSPVLASELVEVLLRAGKTGEAAEVAREAETFAPEDQSVLEALALTDIANGRLDQARSVLLRMSRFAGFDAGRLYRIAELQLRIDSAGDAIYALEKALQADPDFLTARVLLIDSQRRLGRLGAARDGALLAIQLRPGHPAGYRLLGDVESALGRPSAALENHRKALELRRQTPYLLKVFESLSAIGELEPARQLLTDWVTDNPDDYRARQVLADSHLRVGDLTAARDEYERLLEINQDAPYVLNNLANVLDKIGDDRALDYARRAH